jgi:hypothetical protein
MKLLSARCSVTVQLDSGAAIFKEDFCKQTQH